MLTDETEGRANFNALLQECEEAIVLKQKSLLHVETCVLNCEKSVESELKKLQDLELLLKNAKSAMTSGRRGILEIEIRRAKDSLDSSRRHLETTRQHLQALKCQIVETEEGKKSLIDMSERNPALLKWLDTSPKLSVTTSSVPSEGKLHGHLRYSTYRSGL